MIKKILLPLLTIAVLSGCGNEKAQEKTLLDSVINAHDKVMGDDGMTLKVRVTLKTLLSKKPQLKDSVDLYLKKLDDNDNAMSDWMNKFNPDLTGKSHGQIMTYLESQKKEVTRVDTQIKLGIYQATNFFIRNNKK